MITMTSTGAVIWQALEKDCDRETIVRMLMERFEVDPETAAADTDEFLMSLRKLDLIEGE